MNPGKVIQWFPGHMAKTRRLISENLREVDAVIELLDSRIPLSSRNPEIRRLVSDKKMITFFTKSSLSDPGKNRAWEKEFARSGEICLFIDSITGEGIDKIAPSVRSLLSEKIERNNGRGMTGKALRCMVVGIPNVGKSSLINRLCGAKKAKVEDRPGVTLTRQWVKCPGGLELLDMPGVLWPKFDDRTVGENLALTGAVKDAIMDTEYLAVCLISRLRALYPSLLCDRYKLDPADIEECEDYEVFEKIGRKRGFLVSGGEINTERTSVMLLDEFRSAKIGRISLESPDA